MKIIRASAILAIFAVSACGPNASQDPAQISIEVLSNQPYLLSDNNALIEVSTDVSAVEQLRVLLNNSDANIALELIENDGEIYIYRGLLHALSEGENTLQISAGNGAAQLSLINYPRTGPIFSGEQQTPYFCLAQLSLNDGDKRRFAIG